MDEIKHSHQLFKNFIHSIHPTNPEELEIYLQAFKFYEAKKNQFLTRCDEVENHLYFVVEGVQKAFYTDIKKEHVMAFTYSPSFSGVPDSFFSQLPSEVSLKLISDSKFLRIHRDTHNQLLESLPSIERMFRKALELALVDALKKHQELLVDDMPTRFKKFAHRSPHLFQLVSNKDIASYLKMDATNFSKLLGSHTIQG